MIGFGDKFVVVWVGLSVLRGLGGVDGVKLEKQNGRGLDRSPWDEFTSMSSMVSTVAQISKYTAAERDNMTGIIYALKNRYAPGLFQITLTGNTSIEKHIGLANKPGYVDGHLLTARFEYPKEVLSHKEQLALLRPHPNHVQLFSADGYTFKRIRKIDLITNTVTTIAGTSNKGVKYGSQGPGKSVRFWRITGLEAIPAQGTKNPQLYIADQYFIHKLDLVNYLVETVAGGEVFATTVKDGIGTHATFQGARQVALDQTYQHMYVMDDFLHSQIRKINLQTKEVTTLVKSPSYLPQYITHDPYPNTHSLYIAAKHDVRRIDLLTGETIQLTGDAGGAKRDGLGTAAQLTDIVSMFVTTPKNIMVVTRSADSKNGYIRLISRIDPRNPSPTPLPTPTMSTPPISTPISDSPSATPISASPISSSPISASPITSSPISASPITSSPISAHPASAPVVAPLGNPVTVPTMATPPVSPPQLNPPSPSTPAVSTVSPSTSTNTSAGSSIITLRVTFPSCVFSHFSHGEAVWFRGNYTKALSAAGGIPKKDVVITAIMSGSTVVESEIVCNTEKLLSSLLLMVKQPADIFTSKNHWTFSRCGVPYIHADVTRTASGSTQGGSSSRSDGNGSSKVSGQARTNLILFICIPVVILLLLFLAWLFCKRQKASDEDDGPDEVKEEKIYWAETSHTSMSRASMAAAMDKDRRSPRNGSSLVFDDAAVN